MGDPKKQRKKYNPPRFPWRTDTMQAELRLIGDYGLRNKHELWRHETMLSKFRGIARALIGETPEERKKMEGELLARLKKIGVLEETGVLDDVLDLTIEDVLERRFQTIVLRKGLAKTMQQARQLIGHGHMMIASRRVTTPGYIVSKTEENQIGYLPRSSLANSAHPLRQTMVAAPPAESRSTKLGSEGES